MSGSMLSDTLRLLPELLLLVGSLVVLLLGSFLPRHRLGRARGATLLVLAASAVAAAVGLGQGPGTAFEGSYQVDVATGAVRVIAVAATALVVLLAGDELADHVRQAEVCVLLLLATLGTVVLAGAADLLLVVTGFLLASVPLYALVGLSRTAGAPEATLKTYLVGSLFGIVLMAGVVLLYGLAGTTAYARLADGLAAAPAGAVVVGTVALLGGLTFKIGAVPGHFWVPDAAQGSSTAAAAFLTTVPKVGALLAAYRLVQLLPDSSRASLLAAVLAVATMTIGNLAAFSQDDPQRLLGWSTVSQAGYLLVPVAVAGRVDLALPALVVYLAGYAVTNLAAFAVVAALPERRGLDGYAGLAGRHPWLATGLVVSLLGLVGTPPTAVFVGKLAVATAAWEGGYAWLSVALLVNSLLSLFYYLRWIAPVLRRSGTGIDVRRWGRRIGVLAGLASVVVGLGSAALWQVLLA